MGAVALARGLLLDRLVRVQVAEEVLVYEPLGVQVFDVEAGELRAQSFPQVVLCALGDPARVAGALSAWEVILGSWSGPKMTSAITVRTGSLGMDRSNTVQLLSRPPDCSGDSSSSARPA